MLKLQHNNRTWVAIEECNKVIILRFMEYNLLSNKQIEELEGLKGPGFLASIHSNRVIELTIYKEFIINNCFSIDLGPGERHCILLTEDGWHYTGTHLSSRLLLIHTQEQVA